MIAFLNGDRVPRWIEEVTPERLQKRLRFCADVVVHAVDGQWVIRPCRPLQGLEMVRLSVPRRDRDTPVILRGAPTCFDSLPITHHVLGEKRREA